MDSLTKKNKATTSVGLDIDQECMKIAEQIKADILSKKVDKSSAEKAVNEALAILQENGLYALVIYLEAESTKKSAEAIAFSVLHAELQAWDKGVLSLGEGTDFRQKVRNISGDLFKLFFTIDLMVQTLIYSRYLAKGLPEAVSAEEGTK